MEQEQGQGQGQGQGQEQEQEQAGTACMAARRLELKERIEVTERATAVELERHKVLQKKLGELLLQKGELQLERREELQRKVGELQLELDTR